MIELEVSRADITLLMSSLKIAEIEFGNRQEWQAAKAVARLHQALHYQVFTYGQMEKEE